VEAEKKRHLATQVVLNQAIEVAALLFQEIEQLDVELVNKKTKASAGENIEERQKRKKRLQRATMKVVEMKRNLEDPGRESISPLKTEAREKKGQ